MKYHHFIVALLLAMSSLDAGILIDFGMNGSVPGGSANQTTPIAGGVTTNNIAVSGITSGAATLTVNGTTGQASANLLDNAGNASGVTLVMTYSATATYGSQGGTAGSGGNYSGTVASDAAALFPDSATRDSVYVNNSNGGSAEVLTLSFSGLAAGQTYDIIAFGGRNTAGSTSGSWRLTTGTATAARYQDGTGAYVDNTGQVVTTAGTNAGLSPQWRGASPDASGNLTLTLTAASGTALDLNALSIAPAGTGPVGGEVDVYLLGGQSNMQGLGKLSELTSEQRSPAPDVFYWNGSSFVPLIPGTTVTAAAGEFGPEIAFATEIAKRGRPAYLIKCYDGGKALDSGWDDQAWIGDPPAPNRVNFHPGLASDDPNQGTLYKNAMLPTFRAAIQSITASGKVPVVKGLVWMQGEQDSKNLVSAGRYAGNLKRLRDRLAADLGLAKLPVVFGQVLPFEPSEPRFTCRTEIRAEMALADMDSGSSKAIPLCRMISTDGYPVYPSPDAVHYTTAGQLALGTAFAGALGELLDGPSTPIYVAFHHGNDANALETAMSSANPPPQGNRVNTATDTWNNVTRAFGSAGSLSGIALADATGASSGTTLSGSHGYGGGKTAGYAHTTKDHVMMEGWLGLSGTETLTVTGLPAALAKRYHVIVYGDADNSRSMSYTLGGVTKTILDNGTFGGTFAEGSNFVVFSGLSGTSFSLTGNATTPRSAVSGFSIIAGDPPAPPAIGAFSASRHYIAPGSPATLSWQVSGADTVEIQPAVGTVAAAGTVTINPSATTTYTLTATNPHGTRTASLRVGVGPARPNILLFLVDDMGWQDCSLPFYFPNGTETRTNLNNTYRTPNLETLATHGMRFTNACAHPVCSPSRVTLMTGMHPARHHVTNWTYPTDPRQTDNGNATLNPPPNWAIGGMSGAEPTIPGMLQSAGYRTIHAGKAHFGPNFLDSAQTIPGPSGNPLNIGFDVNIAGHGAGGPGSYASENYYGTAALWHVPGLEKYYTPTQTKTHLTEALTLEINQSIAKAVADGAPFFAYMSHYAIHAPYETDPRFAANYPTLSGNLLGHATLIEGMDKSLGDILAKLRELGVAENTLIIFMGDNGAESPNTSSLPNPSVPLRGRKGFAYEGGSRVPFLVTWAQRNPSNPLQQALPIAPGSHQDDIVSIEDLFDTTLDVAGVSHSVTNDGSSLVPYFRGEVGVHRPQEFITHFPHAHNDTFYSTLRQGDWKLIYRYLNRSWELYDLSKDIGESNNLVVNPTADNAVHLMRMARHLAGELQRMGAQFPTEDATGNVRGLLMPDLASVDSDGDGVPDLAEDPNRNGLVDPGETNPDSRDSDGDGTPDGAEARLGTNPLDPSSAFRGSIESRADTFRLSWPSLPGSTFTIQASQDLLDWSQIVAAGIPAAADPA